MQTNRGWLAIDKRLFEREEIAIMADAMRDARETHAERTQDARSTHARCSAIVGDCLRVWCWASENGAPDDADNVRTRVSLGALAEATGVSPHVLDAMALVGWIVVEDGKVLFPKLLRWIEHRTTTARRNARTTHAKRTHNARTTHALEQEQEQDTKKDSPCASPPDLSAALQDPTVTLVPQGGTIAKPPFRKPTILEIREYVNANTLAVDPEAWFDHYEACGWMIGPRKPMRDWRAAVRNWHRNADRFAANGKTPPAPVALTPEQIAAKAKTQAILADLRAKRN